MNTPLQRIPLEKLVIIRDCLPLVHKSDNLDQKGLDTYRDAVLNEINSKQQNKGGWGWGLVTLVSTAPERLGNWTGINLHRKFVSQVATDLEAAKKNHTEITKQYEVLLEERYQTHKSYEPHKRMTKRAVGEGREQHKINTAKVSLAANPAGFFQTNSTSASEGRSEEPKLTPGGPKLSSVK